MTQIVRQFSGAVLAAVVVILVLFALTKGSFLEKAGAYVQGQLRQVIQMDKDTQYAMQNKPDTKIRLKTSPMNKQWYTAEQLISATENNQTIPCRIIGIKLYITGEDAVAKGMAILEPATQKIFFTSGGDYRLMVRSYGSVRRNKTFVVHITGGES
ncbi:hypothetical protein [Eubacterium oxidoreducens]|uniref:Uncharacterized protein n=1 Tax=Eubacterium oxidoreducens TaxID=1732 RepID=A0A1G6BD29_EUBOX|nr:hypothetical protein [Eubacterium oxidoreducens]SDB18496.1 hypothetical protein SAMN02910417_01390 [Eubacterium oxidoreducens]